jgi:predicted site-specific integrase-resolvase
MMTEIDAMNLTRAAEKLGVSVTQVRRLVEQGRLDEADGIASGRERFVTAESVERYQQERKVSQ